MPPLPKHRLIKALLRQPVDVTPVWLMRQAGRYLPEYRRVRAQAGNFMNLCKNPELACEVTLQPLARFDLDAAIIFSDILTIPDAMGLGLYFVEGEGPKFQHPIRDIRAINKLGVPDPETELNYVLEAIRLTKRELADKVPLIGFCGSPWTLATYMVEGESSRIFQRIKALLQQEPAALHQLLKTLAAGVTQHLNAQIRAGASAVMIFDTWGGILDTPDFQQFSLDYLREIVSGLIKEHEGQIIPSILFVKQGGQWLTELAASGCQALSIDASMDVGAARLQVGQQVAIQGNLDNELLLTTPEIIREEVAKILERFGAHSGHVFNLGHGILQQTPPENVASLVAAVHELSPQYHTRNGS